MTRKMNPNKCPTIVWDGGQRQCRGRVVQDGFCRVHYVKNRSYWVWRFTGQGYEGVTGPFVDLVGAKQECHRIQDQELKEHLDGHPWQPGLQCKGDCVTVNFRITQYPELGTKRTQAQSYRIPVGGLA